MNSLGSVSIEVTNRGPDTGDDFYVARPGQTLIVSATEGVRINDTDQEDDAFIVNLSDDPEQEPAHGTVVFNVDGSFSYTPDAGFLGYDWFFYTPDDGLAEGDNGLVMIYVTNGSLIGDEVWNDLDEDGLQGVDEPGVPGITVRLLDPIGGVVSELLTDNDGRFVFDVVPGTYRLQVVVPAGASISPANVGTEEGGDSAIGPSGLSDLFTLVDEEAIYGIDAGLFGSNLPLPEQETGSIGDRVWHDLDADGIQDFGESGPAGIGVTLLNSDDDVVATTTTGANGAYNFPDAPTGWLRIRVDLPIGSVFTVQYAGESEELDSDVDELGDTGLFYLYPDGVRTEIDAGVTTVPSSVLGGSVWMEMNADGIRNTSEIGMSGITVNLLDATGLVVATTVTAMDGTYSFTNVAAGQYRVQFVPPMGYSFTTANQGSNESVDSDVTDPLAGTTDLFTFSGGTNLDVTAGLSMSP